MPQCVDKDTVNADTVATYSQFPREYRCVGLFVLMDTAVRTWLYHGQVHTCTVELNL